MEDPPHGFARWNGGLLAKSLGESADRVWRELRHLGISLQRRRSWCVSTDPQFSQKAADVIGLYLSPPQPGREVSDIRERTFVSQVCLSAASSNLMALFASTGPSPTTTPGPNE
jgi:hypothetical protein